LKLPPLPPFAPYPTSFSAAEEARAIEDEGEADGALGNTSILPPAFLSESIRAFMAAEREPEPSFVSSRLISRALGRRVPAVGWPRTKFQFLIPISGLKFLIFITFILVF
jgi:hypothetical protein